MQVRKEPLVNNHYYHIFSRSIAGYVVFNDSEEFNRIYEIMHLFRYIDFDYKYSNYKKLEISLQAEIFDRLQRDSKKSIDIIAYCLMPTHIHLILKQKTNNGISKYMSKLLNSYTRYFNTVHKRTGPLWTGRFKSVLVEKDEQLLHLTRYIHLNPVSAGLVDEPDDWGFSSHNEYIEDMEEGDKICNYKKVIDITPADYKKFVGDRKDYQKQLSQIKSMLIDHYSG